MCAPPGVARNVNLGQVPENPMKDLVIIGAGPGGIGLAAEAYAAGIDSNQILLLEKTDHHNAAIRQLYPEQKLTTANYKGFDAKCEGLLCIRDMNKSETIAFFDKVIDDYQINIDYLAEVHGMERIGQVDGRHSSGARFHILSSKGTFESRVLGVAIGIFWPTQQTQGLFIPTFSSSTASL